MFPGRPAEFDCLPGCSHWPERGGGLETALRQCDRSVFHPAVLGVCNMWRFCLQSIYADKFGETSRFWHQINRRLIADPTKFILHNVFNMDRLVNDNIVRYTTLLFHFLISGMHHFVIDIASGIPWHESGAVRFFLMQGLGIIFERIVRFSYRTVFPGSYMDSQPAWWIRILGHVRVIVFLAWTIPGWMYPMIRRTRGGIEDSLLPFSVLAHVF